MSNSKYINDWIKENKETIKVQVPKGKKAIIEEHRKAKGYTSTNQYIVDLIDADLRAHEAPVTGEIATLEEKIRDAAQSIQELPEPGTKVAKL